MESRVEQPAGIGEAQAEEIALRLNERLAAAGIGARVKTCAMLAGGLEDTLARLELEKTAAPHGRRSPLPMRTPLVLRVCRRPDAAVSIAWEARVQAVATRYRIPAPRVFHVDLEAQSLGGAFMLMEFMPGTRLDDALSSSSPAGVLALLRSAAAMQTAVFAVRWRPRRPPNPTAAPAGLGGLRSIHQRMAGAEREIRERCLPQLQPVLDWLRSHRGDLGRRPRVFLHGDFHPRNLLASGNAICAVLDWPAAAIGDPHEDIAWATLLLSTLSAPDAADDARLDSVRSALPAIYLRSFHNLFAPDANALRYCEVWAALRWLLIFLPSYLPNAGAPLLNPDAAGFVSQRYVERIIEFIADRTSGDVRLASEGLLR
jgi:aminoglycoside phosphotransferase (APT) family kinase protein